MDENEFEKVFWALHPQLLHFASYQLSNYGAEDVVAETMTTLWTKNLPHPADEVAERQLRAFAFTVLTGHIRNELRSRRRRSALWLRSASVEPAARHGRDETEAIDDIDAIRTWLDRLPPSDREVVLLFNAGFDVDEMAAILGCTASAAAKRRTRAKARLRSIVEQERGAGS